jgi:hypothetical protein
MSEHLRSEIVENRPLYYPIPCLPRQLNKDQRRKWIRNVHVSQGNGACKPRNRNRAVVPRHQGQLLTVKAGTSQGAAQLPEEYFHSLMPGTWVERVAGNLTYHQAKSPKTVAFSESRLQDGYACEDFCDV